MILFRFSQTCCGALRAKGVLVLFLNLFSGISEAREAILPENQREILEAYCYDCHDSSIQKGKVNLEDLPFHLSKDIETAELWSKVLNVINSGEMPPEDEIQLLDEEKTAFLQHLSTGMVEAREILSDSGGVITVRRLNRREYSNSLYALLGTYPEVDSLPEDDQGGGFDNSGANLFFSPYQLQEYLAVARQALQRTRNAQRQQGQIQTQVYRVEPEVDRYRKVSEEAERYLALITPSVHYFSQVVAEGKDKMSPVELGLTDLSAARSMRGNQSHLRYLAEYLGRPENLEGVALFSPNGTLPSFYSPRVGNWAGGAYELRIRAGVYEGAPEHRQYLEYGIKEGESATGKILGVVKVKGTVKKPELLTIPLQHPARWGARYFIRHRDYKDQSSRWREHVKSQRAGDLVNADVWVDFFEVEGPFPDRTSEVRPANLVPPREKGEGEEQYIRRVLLDFATTAFRDKEPSSKFLEALMKRYSFLRMEGQSLEKALFDCYALILSSPSFLYLLEPGSEEKKRELSERELAVRLSFFLWNAPPDEELLQLARAGELSNPGTLVTQTRRLLDDSRSDSFLHSFAHQWLHMERLETFDFDERLHPRFDESVRRSARMEVYETIRHLLDEGHSLRNLLKSDTVVINDVMADHYDIDGVEGSHFRPVKVPEGSPRGGLMAMAAVLIMGSDGHRSSPVERGAWILRYLLDDPSPPAPPNIPMLSRISEVVSARELQQIHQSEPQCAQCHQKIDPVGYGLENFTAAGLWREKEEVAKHRSLNLEWEKEFEIDPSGTLSTGESFANYYELRDIVAGKEKSFARGFAKHLIAYGLGRPYSFSDEKLAVEMINRASKQDLRIEAFIHELVQSKAFRSK